jgi:hypothetical protein
MHLFEPQNVNNKAYTKLINMSKIKHIKVDWDSQKALLKSKYSNLTDRDLNFEKGNMEMMLTKLQNKLGISRHQIYTFISKH